MKIKLEKRASYGRVLVYPVCEISKHLAKLAGKACFNRASLELLKELGYEHNIKNLEDVI